MAKKSHIQMAIENIEAEINERTRALHVLKSVVEQSKPLPKRERKTNKAKAKVVVADSGV